ncbi:MAG: putative bifunctional diguanylate cyclase/phosphodiesterase, partial [Janthinobacterium lividum]
RAADLALYQAKEDGRQSVRVFKQEMDTRARARHALLDDLRRALALQQFEVHYQPQTNLGSRQLVGFEALVRWRHPELGLIPPDRFIPLAEEVGLIVGIGEWVLRKACLDAMSWPGQLSVAVNVSAKQLEDPNRLPRVVEAALAVSGLPAKRLEVEITESALVRYEQQALQVLHTLRAKGVRVSMDDFGTGYSSLSQLRSFPFDKLKIDRSFVRDLSNSDEAVAVIRAIAALGASLGMTTTAEGVETDAQETMVRNDGCTDMQGYLVSRPVPAENVAELIRSLAVDIPTFQESI